MRENTVRLPSDPTVQDFRFDPPGFSCEAVGRLLLDAYGLEGRFTPLAGERDQNFRLDAEGGAVFVVKISGPGESADAVDFQTGALLHLREADPGLGVPRVVETREGASRTAIAAPGRPAHHFRVLTHVSGMPLDSLGTPSLAALRAVGHLMGRLDRALATLPPPAKREFLAWDVMNGLTVMAGFGLRYLPDALTASCAPFLERFAAEGLPRLHDLPEQVIHNDLHCGNVLCDPENPDRLTGCIDFGDMVCRPVVMELASLLGESVGASSEFLPSCRAVLDGYRAVAPFSDDFLPLLHDASLARAILCAQLAKFRLEWANLDPDIEAVHLPGAIQAAQTLSEIDREAFADVLSA